jgi:Protein of unknown function (DUF3489)
MHMTTNAGSPNPEVNKATGKKPRPKQKKPGVARKTTPAKKAAAGARSGSKTEKMLDLLKRPNGATLKELMKATGWQPHSVRGFLSGTLGKKMGLRVESARQEDKERMYRIASK